MLRSGLNRVNLVILSGHPGTISIDHNGRMEKTGPVTFHDTASSKMELQALRRPGPLLMSIRVSGIPCGLSGIVAERGVCIAMVASQQCQTVPPVL